MSLRWPCCDLGRIELARRGGALAHELIVGGARRAAPNVSAPIAFAAAARRCSARSSHHIPKPSMMSDAMMPRPGAANGVVPKNGIGIAFWIAGVPGSADMVKVEVPSTIAAGISRRGIAAARNSVCAIGREHEERDEQADPAIGDDRAGEHDREHRALLPSRSVMNRATAVTEPLSSISLPNSAPSRNIGKNCARKVRGAAHEDLRPVREQRLAAKGGGDQRRGRRQQQHAPAAKGEPDQQRERRRGCREAPCSALRSSSTSRSSGRALAEIRRRARPETPRAAGGPRRAAWRRTPIRH